MNVFRDMWKNLLLWIVCQNHRTGIYLKKLYSPFPYFEKVKWSRMVLNNLYDSPDSSWQWCEKGLSLLPWVDDWTILSIGWQCNLCQIRLSLHLPCPFLWQRLYFIIHYYLHVMAYLPKVKLLKARAITIPLMRPAFSLSRNCANVCKWVT